MPDRSLSKQQPAGPDKAWLARLKEELNPEQYRFATAGEPMILGLAGPGSGKTRALVYRAAHLVRSGWAPERLLLLTFTNKAAEEMRRRLERLLGFLPHELWAGTFHSIGARILRRHAGLVGRTARFTILDEDDTRDMLRRIVRTYPHSLREEERTLLVKRRMLGRIITQAANSALTVREVMTEYYPHRLEYLPLVERLAAAYAERKEAANAFDFDDLLVRWLDLFTGHPEVEETYRRRFRHILVDEFQDTNLVQARLVDRFAGGSAVCVVGDDAQSIYGFRFAQVGNILSLPEKYPGCLVVRMERNYRSTPQIVALADCSIAFNRDRLPKKLYSRQPSGEKPVVIGASTATGEAAFVGRQVAALHASGLPLREMAVLYRSSYLTPEVEFALTRRGLPYRTFGGVKFLQKAHIKDVLAHLKILYNPLDETAWRRAATLQAGIGPSTFAALWRKLRDFPDPLSAALAGEAAPARGKAGWQALLEALGEARRREPAVHRMIEALLERSYAAVLRQNYPDQFEERSEGIERLAFYGSRFQNPAAFLESLALEESLFADASERDPESDYVTLSTIHSAKGKEWEAVFLIGLNDGHFPRQKDDRNLSEERRLFYVAVTRAHSRLYLSTYRNDARSWGGSRGIPSLFLRELPAEIYQAVLLDDYSD